MKLAERLSLLLDLLPRAGSLRSLHMVREACLLRSWLSCSTIFLVHRRFHAGRAPECEMETICFVYHVKQRKKGVVPNYDKNRTDFRDGCRVQPLQD